MPSYIPAPYWRFRVTDTSNNAARAFGVAFIDVFENQYGDAGYRVGGPTMVGSRGSDGSPNYLGSRTDLLFSDPSQIRTNLNCVIYNTDIDGGSYVGFERSVPIWVDRIHWWADGYNGYPHTMGILAQSSQDGLTWVDEWEATAPFTPSNYWEPSLFINPDPVLLAGDPSLYLGGDGGVAYLIDPANSCSDTAGLVPAVDGDPVKSINLLGSGATAILLPPSGSEPTFREGGINERPYLEVSQGDWLGTVNYPIASGLSNISPPYTLTFVFDEALPAPAGHIPLSGYEGRALSKGHYWLLPSGSPGSQIVMFQASMAFGSIPPDLKAITFNAVGPFNLIRAIADFRYGAPSGASNFPSATLTNLEILRAGTLNSGQTFEGRFYGALMTTAPARCDPERAQMWARGVFLGEINANPKTEIFAGPGSLNLSGYAPSIVMDEIVEVGFGSLRVTGNPVSIISEEIVSIEPGSLRLDGYAPKVQVGIHIKPGPDALRIVGQTPLVYTESGTVASQMVNLALSLGTPDASASQMVALTLGEPEPETKSSQMVALALAEVNPPVRASQAVLYALGHGSPCTTQRCQLWTIRRRDGRVFRFTSHDEEVWRGPIVYLPCKSLDPSASENASTLGSVGSIELTGILDHDSISEADLYGGLFDDAYITVDLYSWGDIGVTPRRLSAGWTGSISTGDTGFKMETLGPGSRLEQQALVQMITPGCRWIFGDGRCQKDIEALKISATVAGAFSRGSITLNLPAEPSGRQWANGRISFLTGPNAGQTVETKTVDFATGAVVLWSSPGFIATPGDEVDLYPGCDLTRDGGCTLYANVINFGGFPDVPGSDSLLETPDARY